MKYAEKETIKTFLVLSIKIVKYKCVTFIFQSCCVVKRILSLHFLLCVVLRTFSLWMVLDIS